MQNIKIPESLRSYLKKPFGEVFKGEGLEPAKKIKKEIEGQRIIVVGDVTLKNLLEVGLKASLAIVDLKTKRDEEEAPPAGEVVRVKNPAGWITKELWDAIHENINREDVTILVEGEEDLAVLPAIIEANWNEVVLYGQPDEGIVLVKVTEESKYEVGSIFKIIMKKDDWKFQKEE